MARCQVLVLATKRIMMALPPTVFLFAGAFTAHADLISEITQSLSVENAGVLYEGYEGSEEGFIPTVINGDSIPVPSEIWNINFLDQFDDAVSASHSAYILFRYVSDTTPEDGPETDFLFPGENFEIVHAPIPDGAGPAVVSFLDLPALGTPEAYTGAYSLFVFELPETKTTQSGDPLCEDFDHWISVGFEGYDELCWIEELYTDADLTRWFAWTFGAEDYEGDEPELFGPLNQRRFDFDYVASTVPPVSECCSSVAFIPGLQGSRLIGSEGELWPPAFVGDPLGLLALDSETGESEQEVTVDGIIETFYGTSIYSGFSSFMDSLVASSTINEWKPLAYDWRYSPEYVVSNDVETPDGSVRLVEEIEDLAANSQTGKVTLVAHSMGGLVTKALMKKLEEEGKEDLVDAIVMVGSPQLGTPQAAAGLLHGDAQAIPGGLFFSGAIVNPASARAISRNFPSAHHLLPSAKYFGRVTDPTITFNANSTFTLPWRDFWNEDGISQYNDFVSFITGQGVSRDRPFAASLRVPEVLRIDMVSDAGDFHTEFDDYDFPEHVRVVEVAGWGIPTTKAIDYRTKHFLQSFEPVPTREGDKTVVYPSALSSKGEKYFFNIFDYNDVNDAEIQHRDLLNAGSIQSLIQLVIEIEYIEAVDFVTETKPPVSDEELLRVSTHSPVVLGVYDEAGNFTGVTPGQSPSAQFLFIEENIPGSTFTTFGDSQYVYLPNKGTYTFGYQGTGMGSTTVEIAIFSDDIIAPTATYSDMPTTPTTVANFTVEANSPEEAKIAIDYNGDAAVDTVVAPDVVIPTVAEMLVEFRVYILSANIAAKTKNDLLRRVEKLGKKIEKQKQKNSNTLEKLRAKVVNKGVKNKIDATSVTEVTALVDELLAASGIFPLTPELVTELRLKVEALSVGVNLKNLLVVKMQRLESLASITKSLAKFITAVERKGGRGKIADGEVQEIITMLTQLENSL